MVYSNQELQTFVSRLSDGNIISLPLSPIIITDSIKFADVHIGIICLSFSAPFRAFLNEFRHVDWLLFDDVRELLNVCLEKSSDFFLARVLFAFSVCTRVYQTKLPFPGRSRRSLFALGFDNVAQSSVVRAHSRVDRSSRLLAVGNRSLSLASQTHSVNSALLSNSPKIIIKN